MVAIFLVISVNVYMSSARNHTPNLGFHGRSMDVFPRSLDEIVNSFRQAMEKSTQNQVANVANVASDIKQSLSASKVFLNNLLTRELPKKSLGSLKSTMGLKFP